MTIAARLAETRERIAVAARQAGRDPAGILLVAVSKKMPPERIREAYDAGQRVFGENYAQELAAKAEALGDLRELEWHFIGHLQTNKARLVAGVARAVHTVDSAVLARELGKRVARQGGARLPVLVEVNVGKEPQKAGATPSELEEVLQAIDAEPALVARGLMAMPPAGNLDAARSVFDTVRTLRNLHGGAARLPELSFGMSEDLEVAVACGSTLVRVGSAIFGPRGTGVV